MPRPDLGPHAPELDVYLSLVPDAEILPALEAQRVEDVGFLRSVTEEDSLIRHAPYTWSVREVVGHLIDAERVFAHRAHRFGRGDATPLPGFEENDYVVAGAFDRIPLADLVDEFDLVRAANVRLFEAFPPEAWSRAGVANGKPVGVRALAYAMVGHVRHHMTIVRKRLANV